MVATSWEDSTNPSFYGYLKVLDVQKQGCDLHFTFEKNPKRVHVSLYEVNVTTQNKKLTRSGYVNQVGGVASIPMTMHLEYGCGVLKMADWKELESRINATAKQLFGSGGAAKPPPSPSVNLANPSAGPGGILTGTKATWGQAHAQSQYNKNFPKL